jgi:hypothetical protein
MVVPFVGVVSGSLTEMGKKLRIVFRMLHNEVNRTEVNGT